MNFVVEPNEFNEFNEFDVEFFGLFELCNFAGAGNVKTIKQSDVELCELFDFVDVSRAGNTFNYFK